MVLVRDKTAEADVSTMLVETKVAKDDETTPVAPEETGLVVVAMVVVVVVVPFFSPQPDRPDPSDKASTDRIGQTDFPVAETRQGECYTRCAMDGD